MESKADLNVVEMRNDIASVANGTVATVNM
jgi:hypothetical protein